jgi:poly(ADP-ribose) glycohydrolase ARH3
MRVAPVALFYSRDLNALKDAAYRQSEVTHAHPLAREGSFLQALAIALLLQPEASKRFNPLAFLARLSNAVSKDAPSFSKAFEVIENFLKNPPHPSEVIQRLGHDSRVIRSQPTALYSFLSHPESFEEAVVYAVNLGGDTDTIGAMTGALAGAFHGASSIPQRWLDVLENHDKGRDWIRRLGQRRLEPLTGQ